ncbi:hypothetical protein [Nocardia sp. NBC_01327]|uniref:hypothetical protein n=1 Tax=Nocardia sp. NBC_01327 TaxID=2903593 RepID=UPI002E0FF769|nr:hypothetical protein OG326_34530 [Nocardia sp. NBC_01327]
MTLLLDAGDYPLGQTTISGIGLRVAELAAALAHHFPVRIYSPATGAQEPVSVGGAEVTTIAADWSNLLADAEVVFFFDMPDPSRIQQANGAGKLIVSENAPPIEHLEYPRLRPGGVFDTVTYQRLIDTYRMQLTHSHLFTARSHIGRVTLIANLCAYGLLRIEDLDRSRRLDHRITTIPIGYSTTTVGAHHHCGDEVGGQRNEVLWTGGLWQFYDPAAAVRGVAAARANGIEICLRFLHAAPHPDTHAVRAEITRTGLELGIAEQVVLHTDPIRHDDRDRYLRNAAGLICLARRGIENETSVRLRVRDSRLYGMPLLVDPFGATATELAHDGLAIAVDPDDPYTVGSYLATLATHRTTRQVNPEVWAYEHTTAPLVAQLREHLK